MGDFLTKQLDYIYFLYGAAFFLIAATCFFLYKSQKENIFWKYLGLFGILHGINEWLDLIYIVFGEIKSMFWPHLLILVSSFVYLVEIGRLYTKRNNKLVFDFKIYIFLFLLIFTGWFFYHETGLKNFIRYFFGLVGCLWAGYTVFSFVKIQKIEGKAGKYLKGVGFLICLYGLTQLVGDRCNYFPAVFLNKSNFLKTFGFPIQILRTLIALSFTFFVWKYYYKDSEHKYSNVIDFSKEYRYEKMFFICFVIVFIFGAIGTYSMGEFTENKERKHILNRAKLIASNVKANIIKTLSGTIEDLNSPTYKYINKQFVDYGNSQDDIRYIYLMGKKGKDVFYYMDSYPDRYQETIITEIGEVYPEATKELKQSFITGKPFVEGPNIDEWGCWISGLVPIKDNLNKVVAVLGIDVDADDWAKIIFKSRLVAIFITFLVVLILVIFFLVHENYKKLQIIMFTSFKKLEEMENIINKSQAIVFLWKAQKGWPVEYVSDNITQFGYNKDEFYSKKLVYEDLIHPDDIDRIDDELKKYAKSWVNEFLQEYRIITKNGQVRWVEDYCWARYNKDSEITHYQGIVQDITGRKQSEIELKKAKSEAENANKAKSEFLANMSHEIRTPMNAVIGLTEILSSSQLTKDQRKLIDNISTETTALLSIVNNILDLSKIEAKKLDLENIDFDLYEVLNKVKEVFDLRAKQKGVEFQFDIEKEVPRLVLGDPIKLRQIIINLIDNALKFTHKGFVRLQVRLSDVKGEKILINFSVIDTGIGIPLEKQATIFESFKQADSSTTRKYGGTGLGTTISKKLVELMGGDIGVDSELGVGTVFWVEIPFKKLLDSNIALSKNVVSLKDVPVLVVGIKQLRFFDMLRSWGFRIIESEYNAEIKEKIVKNFVSDKQIMFILVGFDTLKNDNGLFIEEIKQLEMVKDVPIIALDFFGDKDKNKLCETLEINYFSYKQKEQIKLQEFIKKTLQVKDKMILVKKVVQSKENSSVRILVAEDYLANREIIKKHLLDEGYIVDVVEDGVKAVEKFSQNYYDLIFMDLQMPEMDGFEAVQQIRKIEEKNKNNKQAKKVTIIALTAHVVKEFIDRCMVVGMDDYLPKPFKKKELLSVIDKWINGVTYIKSTIITKANDNGELMDLDKVLNEFNNDKDFLYKIIDVFLNNLEKQLTNIEEAIKSKDAQVIQKESHTIKGGAGNLTAYELAGIAHELEQAAIDANFELAMALFLKMDQAYNNLKNYIQNKKGG